MDEVPFLRASSVVTPHLPRYYTVPEVADILRLPDEWDRERWVRARCKDGRLRAKQISRGVWRISDQALAEFLEPAPSVEPKVVEPEPVASVVDGLSPGARRGRLKSSQLDRSQ